MSHGQGKKNEFVQVVLQVKVETDERNKTCSMHAFSNFLGFVGNEAEGIKEDSKIVKPLLIFFRTLDIKLCFILSSCCFCH